MNKYICIYLEFKDKNPFGGNGCNDNILLKRIKKNLLSMILISAHSDPATSE